MKWVQKDGQVSSGQVLRRLGNRDKLPLQLEKCRRFEEDLKKNPRTGKKENKMFVQGDPSHPSETACEDRAAANGL
jgi:hypothetical protein